MTQILRKLPVALLLCLPMVFFSCKTTEAKPPESAQKDVPAKWTRLSFAESLAARLERGDYEGALALFDTIPPEEKTDASLDKLKVSILLSALRIDEAQALASSLEAANPKDTDILYIQALIATAKNDAPTRTKYLNAVLSVDPAHSDAMTGLALDMMGKKSYQPAKNLLIKALAANPNNVDALLALARVYYFQDDLTKAGDTLNLALGKEQRNSDLWAESARVKSETNDLPGAVEDIQKAIDLDPNVYSHWTDYGGYLMSQAKKEEARKAYSRAIDIMPDLYFAYIYRAGLNDDLGYADEAIEDYRKVMNLYPQYFYAAEGLGILLWEKGDYAGAREAFLNALAYNTKNTSYALMITLCHYRDNRPEDAQNFMAKYITTMDRASTEFFLCRLFVDKSGDTDVINRILKEKNETTKSRMLFYQAAFYELFMNEEIAQKYYLEVISKQNAGFFEYRMAQTALKKLENKLPG